MQCNRLENACLEQNIKKTTCETNVKVVYYDFCSWIIVALVQFLSVKMIYAIPFDNSCS